jgi:methoxymalonate biosynthesis acyl carrier protein
MKSTNIVEKTRSFLGRYIRNAEVEDNQDLFASGLVNSLFAMQLVLFIESEFMVKVENEDLDYENFKTIVAIVGFVERKLSAL